jgi:hypothetical protein
VHPALVIDIGRWFLHPRAIRRKSVDGDLGTDKGSFALTAAIFHKRDFLLE